MERFIYLMLPSIFFVKYYLSDKSTTIDFIVTYFKLCFITNIICILFLLRYYTVAAFAIKLNFIIKYSLIALLTNIILVIAYKVISNFIQVKIETKRSSKKNEKN